MCSCLDTMENCDDSGDIYDDVDGDNGCNDDNVG